MIPEILEPNLSLVIAGTALTQESDGLGFYHLGKKDRIWYLLEYGGLTPTPIFTPAERKVLENAKKGNVLNEMYKQLYFEKKQSALLKRRIGITVLNRRRLAKDDDDPEAIPIEKDIKQFISKMAKFKPRVLAMITPVEIFEKCFSPHFPSANRSRGKQDFTIGESEVWLIGNTVGKTKELEELEDVFDKLGQRVQSSVPA
jgi:G:T/U-mismatch repair DNA glycosylase